MIKNSPGMARSSRTAASRGSRCRGAGARCRAPSPRHTRGAQPGTSIQSPDVREHVVGRPLAPVERARTQGEQGEPGEHQPPAPALHAVRRAQPHHHDAGRDGDGHRRQPPLAVGQVDGVGVGPAQQRVEGPGGGPGPERRQRQVEVGPAVRGREPGRARAAGPSPAWPARPATRQRVSRSWVSVDSNMWDSSGRESVATTLGTGTGPGRPRRVWTWLNPRVDAASAAAALRSRRGSPGPFRPVTPSCRPRCSCSALSSWR